VSCVPATTILLAFLFGRRRHAERRALCVSDEPCYTQDIYGLLAISRLIINTTSCTIIRNTLQLIWVMYIYDTRTSCVVCRRVVRPQATTTRRRSKQPASSPSALFSSSRPLLPLQHDTTTRLLSTATAATTTHNNYTISISDRDRDHRCRCSTPVPHIRIYVYMHIY